MPRGSGPYPVVPGLSGTGPTAESGGARPGPGAGSSPESGVYPVLCGPSASPLPRGVGGPGTGRVPPDPSDRAEVSALGGLGHLLAGLGAGHAGPGHGGPGATAPGHDGRLG